MMLITEGGHIIRATSEISHFFCFERVTLTILQDCWTNETVLLATVVFEVLVMDRGLGGRVGGGGGC